MMIYQGTHHLHPLQNFKQLQITKATELQVAIVQSLREAVYRLVIGDRISFSDSDDYSCE